MEVVVNRGFEPHIQAAELGGAIGPRCWSS